ncbi:MAG: site-specific integrase, partial [Geminicoccaceae bacterium]
RVLSNDEIAKLWAETDRLGDFAAIIRLLLLTGQRREEVAAMRWSEIDLERRLWEIPGTRTKNHRPHQVPLSDQVLGILETLDRRQGRDLIFGTGKGGFSGFGQSKARSDRRSGLSGWRVHDLRRTAVTGMVEIGIQPHVVEAVVNHISGHKGGVAGIYNKATYATEKRQALKAWANALEAIAHGRAASSNVVAMTAALA